MELILTEADERLVAQVPTKTRAMLSVFVCDKGNKYAQETILLLHGLGTSSFIWRKVQTPLPLGLLPMLVFVHFSLYQLTQHTQ